MFLRYFNTYPDFLGHVRKRLDKKARVNFKICDIINWQTNNYNTHITQISRRKRSQTMKFGQLIKYNVRNIFLKKNHPENETGRLVPGLFLFFKIVLHDVKASGLIFGPPQLGHPIKTNCIKFQTVDPEICSILIF